MPDPILAPSLASLRHAGALLLAAALRELWPTARFGLAQVTDDGFCCDVAPPVPLAEADLPRIEERMRAIQARRAPIVCVRWPVQQALDALQAVQQPYQAEHVQALRAAGAQEVTVCPLDGVPLVCDDPGIDAMDVNCAFALVSLAGAYWRGDARRPQLTRIQALCFSDAPALQARQQQIADAWQRDHRVLGRQLEIYAFSDAVGTGLPLWLPNGTAVRLELEHLARQYEGRAGFRPVSTPVIARESLYLQSGHLPYYREDMYAPIEIDAERFFLRPMCCPHHHAVYGARPRSYRELPLRIAEYGQVFRYEASGALSGLLRARGFCQNDAHIYCRADQAEDEFLRVMQMHAQYYALLGIEDYHMRLSLPALGESDKYVDDPAAWARAIEIIRAAMQRSGLPFVEVPGEAAFYGPKIDFMVQSAGGQSYAISTNQLDFVAPQRFGLVYTGEDGAAHPVYVIHRAPLGSHERFVAFLLEHFAGALPTWLAPVHACVVPISARHTDYAREVLAQLQAVVAPSFDGCLRLALDDSDERMQRKILRAQQARVPYMLVVGDAEMRAGTLSVRRRDQVQAGAFAVDAFAQALCEEIGARRLRPSIQRESHDLESAQPLQHRLREERG